MPSSPPRVELQIGRIKLEVDTELLELSSERCPWQPFVRASDGNNAERIQLHRVSAIDPTRERPLSGSLAPWGFYGVDGSRVEARIPDDVFAAEAVLRVACQLAAVRQGGIVVHGCGVRMGDRAFVASGPSGAGKSTCARLSVAAGATLLSDEIMGLLPSGEAFGTPFRSDPDLRGSPGVFLLEKVLFLNKGSDEHFDDIDERAALLRLVEQVYRPLPELLSFGDAFVRAGAVLAKVGASVLTFRKHEDAGQFLVEWLRRDD